MVLFTAINNDMANQSVDRSFFSPVTNQLASRVRRDHLYFDAGFWLVNLGMYIISYYVSKSYFIS